MHAFIDYMDFSNMRFTEAMRNFLQAFRLPGEAQKIDRFMLKFAERYFQGNPGTLANAGMLQVLIDRRCSANLINRVFAFCLAFELH